MIIDQRELFEDNLQRSYKTNTILSSKDAEVFLNKGSTENSRSIFFALMLERFVSNVFAPRSVTFVWKS